MAKVKEKRNINYIIKLGLTLFIITTITAIMLAGVHELTKDAIAGQELDAFGLALKTLVPDGTLLEDRTYTAESFKAYTLERSGGGYAYCIEVAPEGYHGPINMIVGVEVVNEDGKIVKRVIGVAITAMSETPGLGDKAKEEPFLSQFKEIYHLAVDETGKINEEPSAIKIGGGDNAVQAITGATVTTKGVIKGVRTALDSIKVSAAGEVSFE
jgi:electron transport complex protein RnfG